MKKLKTIKLVLIASFLLVLCDIIFDFIKKTENSFVHLCEIKYSEKSIVDEEGNLITLKKTQNEKLSITIFSKDDSKVIFVDCLNTEKSMTLIIPYS